jgi:3-oxoacyl-[acyl-carrier-protein] synthase III
MPYEARFESIGAVLPAHRVTASCRAIGAARDCLSRSRYTGADLDCVIDVAREAVEPPVSLAVKRAIGAADATCFDMANACAAVFVLDDLIRRGAIRRGMVVSNDAAAIVDRASSPGIVVAGFTTPALLEQYLGEVDWLIPQQPDLLLALHHHLAEHELARGDKVLMLSVASRHEIGVVMLVIDELEATHGCVH